MTTIPQPAAARPWSTRTTPLTDAELRAAVRAMNRILTRGRTLALEKADHALLAAIFDATEIMPEMLIIPDYFDDLFRPMLDKLSTLDPWFGGVRDEFVQAVG